MQDPKEKFVSQKRKFCEIVINKLGTEKVLDYLSPEESIEPETTSKFKSHILD